MLSFDREREGGKRLRSRGHQTGLTRLRSCGDVGARRSGKGNGLVLVPAADTWQDMRHIGSPGSYTYSVAADWARLRMPRTTSIDLSRTICTRILSLPTSS